MPIQSQRPPAAEAAYPESYREREVAAIVRAARSRYSLLVCGPGGSGKSHLLRFLAFHPQLAPRIGGEVVRLYLDCNAVIDDDAAGLFRALLIEAGAQEPLPREAAGALAALRQVLAAELGSTTSFLILLDRFERVPEQVQPAVLDGLRHLRDYLGRKVAYVLSARTPPPIASLSQEFDDLLAAPAVVWLGPLSSADAAWTVEAVLREHGQQADEELLAALLSLSGRYPRLLRALAMAWIEQPWPLQGDHSDELLRNPQLRRICDSVWRDLDSAAQPMLARLASGELVAIPAGHPLRLSGLVTEEAPGRLRIFSPLFARFVLTGSAGNQLNLTALEQRLWTLLRDQPGRLVPRDELIESLYGDNPDGVNDEALTALVARLRRKLMQAGLGTLEAMRGQGYRYQAGVDRAAAQ